MSHNQIRKQDSKHFGSSGKIYSFGYVAKYDKIKNDNLSFGKYATKMEKEKKVNESSRTHHEFIENKLYSHIHQGLKQLSRHLPNIIKVIAPKISKLQSHFDLVNKEDTHEKKELFENGILNCHICINAMTNESHTEMDSSYTLINVPKQIDPNYRRLNTKFCFHINENTTIIIPMDERIVFLYSGYMLSHHQVLEKQYRPSTTFLNLASYGNKRLFHNMISSFRRQIL